MRQKKQMKMWGLLGLLAALPIISVWAGNNGSDESRKEKMVKSVSVIQPITGTWINLAYKDVRNKYTNPQHLIIRILNYGLLKCVNWPIWGLNIWCLWRLPMKGKRIIRQS